MCQISFDKLTHGIITRTPQTRYVEIENDFETRGADAITLPCIEIGLLAPPAPALPSAFDFVDKRNGVEQRLLSTAGARL